MRITIMDFEEGKIAYIDRVKIRYNLYNVEIA